MHKKPNKDIVKFIEQYGALQSDSRFAYVAVHALEGEPPAVAHSTSQKSRRVVDCYWVIGDDGLFVSTLFDLQRASFVSSPRRDEKIAHEFFVATQSELNPATMERILEKLAAWFAKNRSNCRVLLAWLRIPTSGPELNP